MENRCIIHNSSAAAPAGADVGEGGRCDLCAYEAAMASLEMAYDEFILVMESSPKDSSIYQVACEQATYLGGLLGHIKPRCSMGECSPSPVSSSDIEYLDYSPCLNCGHPVDLRG